MTSSEHSDSAPEIPDFGDGKDAAALRTIGEVANALGIRQHVLRYWEEQFPSLRPLTRAGGRRYYRPDDIALIMRISRLLNDQGYTIKGARQALGGKIPASSRNAAAVVQNVAGVDEQQDPAPNPLTEILGAIRDRLAAALED